MDWVRSPLDLLDLPFSYWQLRPLTETQFVRELDQRGLHLFDRQIEGLHRLRLLVPWLRFKRDGRAIATAVRRQDWGVWEFAHSLPTDRLDLAQARSQRRLHDPTTEPFVARRRLERKVGEVSYRSSEYLYSEHQLLLAPLLRSALPDLVYGPDGVNGVSGPRRQLETWQERTRVLQQIIVALSALEPIYLPQVLGRITSRGKELDDYEAWRKRLGPMFLKTWLEVESSWFRDRAAQLLGEADRIDPLGRWVEVVRMAEPETWKLLKGEARSAFDFRIRAEILLLYYERLVRARRARALPTSTRREPSPFHKRLGRTTRRDPVLTEFGLSPHPRVILVLEGETEVLLFPRILAHFGLRQDREFIAVENAQGVGRDLLPLVAYAVAPQTERAEHGRYLELVRPPTRMLVIADAEGPYTSAKTRQERREVWIDRIMQTLPVDDRTEIVRESVASLVSVETWDRRKQSFEFAHFTDRELTRAIVEIDDRRRPLTEAKLRPALLRLRADRGNLKSLLGPLSKITLADALWPVLKRKITRAEGRGTEARIPIVRAVDLATDLARSRRGRQVIPLEEA